MTFAMHAGSMPSPRYECSIVDDRFINRFVNDSTENETKKFGLGKPVVNLELV